MLWTRALYEKCYGKNMLSVYSFLALHYCHRHSSDHDQHGYKTFYVQSCGINVFFFHNYIFSSCYGLHLLASMQYCQNVEAALLLMGVFIKQLIDKELLFVLQGLV